MTFLNNLHPNELFRFVNVRGPRRAAREEISLYFVDNIYDRISTNELEAVQKKMTALYPTLASRVGGPKQLSEQMADVARYKKS